MTARLTRVNGALRWYDDATTPGHRHGDWHDLCACRGADASVFFGPFPVGSSALAPAMKFCGGCPVGGECFAHALKHEELGIWAGTDAMDRVRLRSVLGVEFTYQDSQIRRAIRRHVA